MPGWRSFLSAQIGRQRKMISLRIFPLQPDTGPAKNLGPASRSERIAKYNRLLEIEQELGDAALYYWE